MTPKVLPMGHRDVAIGADNNNTADNCQALDTI
nr:MAG TPA: hypothetical protein [Caudoviricetes sp.]DAY22392.1 MAG TPA: hypothetical protein [Caudoviricetes sp.]